MKLPAGLSLDWPGLGEDHRADAARHRDEAFGSGAGPTRITTRRATRLRGTKRQLRTLLLSRLKRQKEEDRRKKSAAIHRKISRLAVFQRATTVFCYVSLPYEVETWRLMARMLKLGKRVVVPRVHRTQLHLVALHDPAKELSPGAFGVWEPGRNARQTVNPNSLDLVLVPGLAFDRRGHRLGHGLGYFDRFLRRLPATTPTIGLCYDFQLQDRLPTRPHDQAVGRVIAA